jgi:hypothetical protein
MSIANLGNTSENPIDVTINTTTSGPFVINTSYKIKQYGSIIFLSFRNILGTITTTGLTSILLADPVPTAFLPLVGHNQGIRCNNGDTTSTCRFTLTADGHISFFSDSGPWAGSSQNGPFNSTIVYDCRI